MKDRTGSLAALTIAGGLTLAGLLAGTEASAAKTDVVVLVNGDAITGEVKSLDFGTLRYDTDSMGTVQIDWEDVVSVSSERTLQVEVVNGSRYYGVVKPADDGQQLTVTTASGPVELPVRRVVRIVPIERDERWWQRLEGSLSFGFNAQKGTEVTTLNLAFDSSYRTLSWLAGLNVNSAITDQTDEDVSMRQSVGLYYERFRSDRWFNGWFTTWETNDELGINSRVLLGGGLGRYAIQTNTNQLSITGGLVATHETFTGESESTTNAEGLLQVRYLHRKVDPDRSLNFTTNLYPLLEDFSSFRAETDLSLRYEFIEDLFLDFTLFHSYTSDPPEDAISTDYGITTSLGYSF